MKKKLTRNMLIALVVFAMCFSVIGSAFASDKNDLKYYTDFENMEDAKAAAEELSTELVADGAILMKNDGTLPLKDGAWVSVFGVRADNLMGASDSAGAWSSDEGGSDETVADALKEIGFNVNPTLKAFYDRDTSAIGDETVNFGGSVESSMEIYKDAAFIVISREGGEGSDAPTTKAANGNQEPAEEGDTHKALYTVDGVAMKHSLMLTSSELQLIEYVKAHFDNVIIVLNTSNAIEINDLKNDAGIGAIIDICRPGVGGLKGFAQIVAGLVSPSGHLVDEWPVDFTADPTWYNFGNNAQMGTDSTYLYEDGTKTGTEGTTTEATNAYHGIDYEEGIYLGYKYYETYYYDMYAKDPAGAQEWYDANVAFPFGFGLTYTSFSMNAGELFTDAALTEKLGASVNAADFDSAAGAEAKIKTLYLPVTVTNTGDVAGKEVAQVYVTAPYTAGGIEKSSVVLVGFAKTNVLQPGESETVVVSFNVQDFASWDYLDANNDGVKGDYELDAGEYIVRVMESSHFDCATNVADTNDAYDEVKFTLSANAHQKLDDFSGKELENLFSEENGVYDANTKDHDMAFNATRTASMMADNTSGMTVMSRADFDGTFPQAPTAADLTFHNNILDNWSYWDQYKVDDTYEISNSLPTDNKTRDASYDLETDPWYKTKEDIPETWTQAAGVYDENHIVVYNNGKTMSYPMYMSTEATIKFADMAGVEWDDPKWDEFLNQMTYDELCTLIEFNGYGTPGVDSIEKTLSIDEDGPNNIGSSHCWPSEDLIASTWNVELAAKEGIIMANLALLIGDNGWYGPGMDTHRSAFSGRNNEYYSQDGIQGGYIAAAVVDAAESRGVVCYVKHCLLNDQETDRGVLFVWTTEQALRENYAKVFQMALQEGGSSAAMTGYAREGGFANTSNYNLNTRLYIDQWDVHAYFVTDGYIGWQDNADPDIMVRSGFQTELYTDPYVEYLSGEWDAEKNTVMVGPEGNKTESYTQWYGVRQAAKSVLYMQATSSGNLNGYTGLVIEGGMLMPGTQAVDYSASVSVADKLTPGSTATYTIEEFGGLPMGLTLDANTGEISGTPIESGEFMIQVNVLIDGFINKTGSYMLTIDPAFTMDANGDALDSAKVGSDFMARITSKEFTTEKYETVEYKVVNGALPAGLELAPDGTISGTPTESGIFNVTVNMTATEKSAAQDDNGSGGDSGGSGGDSASKDKTFDYDMTIVVADAEGNTPAAPIEEGTDNTAVLNDLNTRVAALEGKKTSGGSNALAIIALITGVLGLGGACYGIISGLKGKKSK